eukprot:5821813-Prorocentrum_lima.AAC.1
MDLMSFHTCSQMQWFGLAALSSSVSRGHSFFPHSNSQTGQILLPLPAVTGFFPVACAKVLGSAY